jgi:hypothetical protein
MWFPQGQDVITWICAIAENIGLVTDMKPPYSA